MVNIASFDFCFFNVAKTLLGLQPDVIKEKVKTLKVVNLKGVIIGECFSTILTSLA